MGKKCHLENAQKIREQRERKVRLGRAGQAIEGRARPPDEPRERSLGWGPCEQSLVYWGLLGVRVVGRGKRGC